MQFKKKKSMHLDLDDMLGIKDDYDDWGKIIKSMFFQFSFEFYFVS